MLEHNVKALPLYILSERDFSVPTYYVIEILKLLTHKHARDVNLVCYSFITKVSVALKKWLDNLDINVNSITHGATVIDNTGGIYEDTNPCIA